MNVYVVVSGEYSDKTVSAVFLDEEKAMAYCAANNDAKFGTDTYGNYRIWEYNTKDNDINSNIEYGYMYCYRYDDSTKREEINSYIRSKIFFKNNAHSQYYQRELYNYGLTTCYKIYCWLKTEDDKLALKICRDKLAMLKAQKEEDIIGITGTLSVDNEHYLNFKGEKDNK